MKNKFSISEMNLDEREWTSLDVERNGIANIARVAQIGEDADTVMMRKTISVSRETKRVFAFGYSDRVIVFVNGERVFSGNAGWRSRDHRFLGTIGFHDAILLPLNEGENEIVAVVSESFGGWGFAGAIENRAGISFVN